MYLITAGLAKKGNFSLELPQKETILAILFQELASQILLQNLMNDTEQYVELTAFLDRFLPDALQANAPRFSAGYNAFISKLFDAVINQLFYQETKYIEVENMEYNTEYFMALQRVLPGKGVSLASRFIKLYFYYHRNQADITLLFENVFLTTQDATLFSDFCSFCHDLNLVDVILYLIHVHRHSRLHYSDQGLKPVIRNMKTYSAGKLRSFLMNYILFVKKCFETASLRPMISIFTMSMGILKETMHAMLTSNVDDEDRVYVIKVVMSLIKRISFRDDNIQIFISVEFHEYFIFFEHVFNYLNTFKNKHGFFLDLIAIGNHTPASSMV